MEVVSGGPVAFVLLAVEKPGVMALLRWAGGRPMNISPLQVYPLIHLKMMGFQDQNLLVPFSGEPTLTKWGPKGMPKQPKKHPGILQPMEWKSWLLLYIYTWIFQIFKISTFWRIFGWISGTQKQGSPGFSIGFFQNPGRRLQSPENEATPEKTTSSHTETEVWWFVGYVLLGSSHTEPQSSVSVFGGWMSRGTERIEKPTVVRGTSTTSEGHSNWWQLGWSNLTWAPWKWFFSVELFLMTKK